MIFFWVRVSFQYCRKNWASYKIVFTFVWIFMVRKSFCFDYLKTNWYRLKLKRFSHQQLLQPFFQTHYKSSYAPREDIKHPFTSLKRIEILISSIDWTYFWFHVIIVFKISFPPNYSHLMTQKHQLMRLRVQIVFSWHLISLFGYKIHDEHCWCSFSWGRWDFMWALRLLTLLKTLRTKMFYWV